MRSIVLNIRSSPGRIRFVIAGLVFLLAGCGAAETPTSPVISPSPTSSLPPTNSPSPTNSPVPTSSPSPTSNAVVSPTTNSSPPITGPSTDVLVARAREQVARYLNIAPEAVTLQSATPQEWSTGALGCPVPGQVYTQVITPGYLLIFTANNQRYEVHTNDRSDTLILCLNGSPTRLTSTP